MPEPTIPTPTTVAELQAMLRQYPPATAASIFRIRLTPALTRQVLKLMPDRFRLVQPWETKKVADMIRGRGWDPEVIPPWCLTADTLKMTTGGTRILAVLTACRDIETRVQRIPDLPWMSGGIKPPS